MDPEEGTILESEVTPPTQREPSYLPKNIFLLFFHPRQFFSKDLDLGNAAFLVFLLWSYGIYKVAGGLNDITFESGVVSFTTGGWDSETIELAMNNSWGGFWIWALFLGGILALFYQSFGNWWFELKVLWSGVRDRNESLADRIYFHAMLIVSGPMLLLIILFTLLFNNFAQASNSVGMVVFLPFLVFPIWRNIVE